MELKISKVELANKINIPGGHKIACIDTDTSNVLSAHIFIDDSGLTAVLEGRSFHMCNDTLKFLRDDDVELLKIVLVDSGTLRSFESCKGFYFVSL